MEKEQSPKRTITLGQALAVAVTILGALITFYTQTQVRMGNMEIRMHDVESRDAEFEKINAKLDHMQLEIYDIKLEVVKKNVK